MKTLLTCPAIATFFCVATAVNGSGIRICYLEGEKCMGAHGHRDIPYLEGCCPGFECVGEASDWGYVCQPKPGPESVSSIIQDAIGSATICGDIESPCSATSACCVGLLCVDQDGGKVCKSPADLNVAQTIGGNGRGQDMRCLDEGRLCQEDGPSCCEGLSCASEPYGNYCVYLTATSPSTTEIETSPVTTATPQTEVGQKTFITTTHSTHGGLKTDTGMAVTTVRTSTASENSTEIDNSSEIEGYVETSW